MIIPIDQTGANPGLSSKGKEKMRLLFSHREYMFIFFGTNATLFKEILNDKGLNRAAHERNMYV